MEYHSDIHHELVKERRKEQTKDRREGIRELERDREEFLDSGQTVAMPQSQLDRLMHSLLVQAGDQIKKAKRPRRAA